MPPPDVPHSTGPLAVTGQVEGTRETILKLEKLDKGIPAVVRKQVALAAQAIERGAKKRAKVGVSGFMRSGIHRVFEEQGLVAVVGANSKYAAMQEFGTSRYGKQTNRQPLPTGYRHGSTHKLPVRVSGFVGFGGAKRWEVVPELALWAKRKRVNPMGLALAIAGRVPRRGGRKIPGVPARPFLGPPFREEARQFPANVAKAIDDFNGGLAK